MNLRGLPWSKIILYLTIIFIVLQTLIEHLIANSLQTFWLDESLMFYIANHPPANINLFVWALQETMSAMPWGFIEYWAYLELLKNIVSLNHLMEHLEFYLRLPLTIYSLGISLCVFIMSRRLCGSALVAGILTLFLATLSHTFSHLGSELRFHTSGVLHCALSWCLLACLLTSQEKPRRVQYTLFFSWVISVLIAGASHIFSTYSLFVQIIVFVLADHNMIPGFSLNTINRLLKTTCLFLIYGFGIVAGLFFQFVMVSSGARTPQDIPLMQVLTKSLSLLSRELFLPNVGLWFAAFIFFVIIKLARTAGIKDKIKLGLLALLGLTQLTLKILLSVKYLRAGYGPESWIGRYTIAGLVPFIFVFSYFAKDIIPKLWENKLSVAACFIGLILFFLNSSVNDSYWGKHARGIKQGDPRWLSIREEILKNDAYGKVNYVLGLNPDPIQHTQTDIHGVSVDITWQLYTQGPFAITQKQLRTLYGGHIGIPCEARDKLPLAVSPAQEYAVDFCEKDKAILRVVKF